VENHRKLEESIRFEQLALIAERDEISAALQVRSLNDGRAYLIT
jgi:hypothetical protein